MLDSAHRAQTPPVHCLKRASGRRLLPLRVAVYVARMRPILIVPALFLSACLAAATPPGPPAPPAPPDPPTRVILLIGDGVGISYWAAARFAAGRLRVEESEVIGLVDTRNSAGRITDSAAGATTYATGISTFNGAIGVGADSLPVETVLEIAERQGMATGLVATSSLTHATPASFAAHVPSRRMEQEIAEQMAGQGIDVLLGGGRGFFDGSLRADQRDLLTGLRARYTVVESPGALRELRLDTVQTLLGLFAENNPPALAERPFSLAELTSTAIAVLDRDPDGFFLMVEGSQPDWRGHDNQPLETVVAEMLDFDAAIGAALDYARRTPGTLVIVTSDHETGGLALEQGADGSFTADYTTTGHTGTIIPLFATGPGAQAFGRVLSTHEVGALLLEQVRASANRSRTER